LAAIEHSAWLCIGDFNETLYATEHFSRTARPEWQMRAFREVIEHCSFSDLGWSGVEYTWDNGQMGESNVKARLDRAFGNEVFLNKFEHISMWHIVTTESDHCFVLVKFCENMAEERGRGGKQFRYENVWQTHADYDKLVLDNWQKGAGAAGLGGVVQALNLMQESLSSWGAKDFGCLAGKGRKLRQKLDRLRGRSVRRGPTDEEKAIVKQLRETLRQEEIWMKQRSRVQWLREGDRNTAYFHSQAAQRKRINKISDLERSDGTKCISWEENCEEIQGFYQNLYMSQGFKPMDELLDIVPVRVTPAMNADFDKSYTTEEVKAALFHMAPSKAPGVDGFTAGFFQRHWELLQHDIVPTVLGFLNGGELPIGLNDTSITLIPKVRHPQRISQYRPISLCSVLYKIASKCIAYRAKGSLGEIIGEEQSAFVPGRLITDNVLIAYESVHAMRKRKKGKNHVSAVTYDESL
jgi:hypothetical protein